MGIQNQPSKVQLVVNISLELHRRIELAAAQRDLLIEEYLEEILEQEVHPMLPKNRESLERLLQTRERLIQERQGRPFSDTTEIIRQMREERSQHLADL